MKKKLAIISILFIMVLSACGNSDSDANSDSNEIKVGASSVPHAEILEKAKPLLEENGITLEIEEYQDYILPNDDLDNGTLDANYFQHIPYLEQAIEDTGYDLDYIDAIHIEPMGIYSKKFDSIDNIPDGTEVIFSNSVSDHGRVLSLLEKAGFIKLDKDVDKAKATIDDVVENPKNLEFSPDYDPAILPELYDKEDDTLLAINTNYAMDADLNPLKDALIIEGDESSYLNVIAVRSEDKENEALNTLVDVLQSDEIKEFIEEKYDGAIIPASEKD